MYTTVGKRSSRSIDCCDHEHESRDDAQRCLLSHQNEMRRAGNVSHREIIEVETLDEVYDNAEIY
jgi:hypothetical protein